MPSPTPLLTKLRIVELLLLLLHLSRVLRLLHRLLVAHHHGDLANLLRLQSQALDELFTWLLVATKAAEFHAVVKGLTTTHTKRHCLT
tara:strand:- start:2829 stop:3092 length:264 start_codon:yes stop_codon:yes gene_type:complete